MAVTKRLLTLGGRIEHEIDKRKGSRFMALAFPLRSSSDPSGSEAFGSAAHQVKAELSARRAAIPSACHHCYAFRCADGQEYCSDDGEPHSTAGKPILSAIQRAGLVDTCVVVSRIFGGVKLGTGGLIRAYGAAASEVLDRAECKEFVLQKLVRVRATIQQVQLVRTAVAKFQAEILDQQFDPDDLNHAASSNSGGMMQVSFQIQVSESQEEALKSYLRSCSSGSITII